MTSRTRSPNPLPEVDSRWVARDRRDRVIVIDRVVFDEDKREERIFYREETTGYRGSTWRSRFRQRSLFAPVGAAAALPLPTASAPAEQGPPCSECGAPCPKRAHGGYRSTCSPKCLAGYRIGMMAKGHAIQVAARNAPEPSETLAEARSAEPKARSFQSSIRMTPEVKEALETIAAELSTVGPYPRPWSVAEVMALALDRFIAEHAARKAAKARPLTHLRSVK